LTFQKRSGRFFTQSNLLNFEQKMRIIVNRNSLNGAYSCSDEKEISPLSVEQRNCIESVARETGTMVEERGEKTEMDSLEQQLNPQRQEFYHQLVGQKRNVTESNEEYSLVQFREDENNNCKSFNRINYSEDGTSTSKFGGMNGKNVFSGTRKSRNSSSINRVVNRESDAGIHPIQDADHELFSNRNFLIKEMSPDGNCLFRSIADQIYGDQDMHDQVRERCMNYMEVERDHFSQFVTEDFDEYLSRKRKDRCYGNNLEIQAIGELYNRPVEIYAVQNGRVMRRINIFHGQYETDNAPIRLSYHDGNHYNSVIDPERPSVGVGLGMPNLVPGLADKMQMVEALEQSENAALECALLNETRMESELEVANREIEESILAQSRKEYFEKLYESFAYN